MTDSGVFDSASMFFYIWLDPYGHMKSTICISKSVVEELEDEYVRDVGSLKPIKIMPDPFHNPSEYGVAECNMVLCSYGTERQTAIETFAELEKLGMIFTFKSTIEVQTKDLKYGRINRITHTQEKEFVKLVIKHCRTIMLPIVKVDTNTPKYPAEERSFTFHISGNDISVADSVIVLTHISKIVAEQMELTYQHGHDQLALTSVCFSTHEMRKNISIRSELSDMSECCSLDDLRTIDADVRSKFLGKLLTKLINTHDDALKAYSNRDETCADLFTSGDIYSDKLIRIPSHPNRIPFIEDCRLTQDSNVYKVCDFLMKTYASKDESCDEM